MAKTREEIRERERAYWARPENRERKRAKDKRYYEKHKQEFLEKTRAYILTHPEQRKETCKRYYRNHKDKESLRMKKYLENNQEKYNAHLIVRQAVRNNELEPQPCEVCGETKTEAHHDDYNKPLEVRWLCHKCHMAYHAKERRTDGEN